MNNLYLVVVHRNAEKQTYSNTWGSQGRLEVMSTTEAVIKEAEKAMEQGSKIFVCETACPRPQPSHISQQVQIAEINKAENKIVLKDHVLIYRHPPFRANQGMGCKWHAEEPTRRV